MGLLKKIWNPELFQGSLRRRGYFEGWYFKLLSADESHAMAFIPGISLGGKDAGESHAFVQYISKGRTEYFRYPLEAFDSGGSSFYVRIGENLFSRGGISLSLHKQSCDIEGTLSFSDMVPFPKSPLHRGVMGPFGYVPGLECYHGVVSLRHGITGSLAVGGQKADFSGGTGYIEKDWGRSFPRAWVWVQANRFAGDASLLLSAADIPFLRGSFRGFFAALYLEGKLHLFATYTGAHIVKLCERGGMTEAVITGRGGTLEVSARPGPCGFLKAPKNGMMSGLIEESLQAAVKVRLTDGKGVVLFEGECNAAGMERYEFESLVR